MSKLFDIILKNFHFVLGLYAAWIIVGAYEKYGFNRQQQEDRISTLKAQIKKDAVKIKQIDQFKRDLEGSEKRVQEVFKQIENVKRRLPNQIQDTQVLSQLVDVASDLNIKNPIVKAEKEVGEDFYFKKYYSFNAEGTFIQFLVYLEQLMETERIYNINSVVLKQRLEKQKGRYRVIQANASIETFRYNQNFKENVEVDAK